ncbi:MAG: glycerol-3-phosphate dehydrogenase [Pseudomonadota bacterium]
MTKPVDLFIVGGGVNGVGIARDAAGRGLSVTLVEMNDLASATSSGSTKLFHGGLRYLEYFEFGLVRSALEERETLLKAMPHISWPMRFVLPINPDLRIENDTTSMGKVLFFLGGRRPAWLTRLGLFLYDSLGGRKILPATRTLNLNTHAAGAPLKTKFSKAFEYSDCWVEDARLVSLNARDAAARGAEIRTRTRFVGAERESGLWKVTIEQSGAKEVLTARAIVNAAGPWAADVLSGGMRRNSKASLRLVRGSHIVVRKLFDHDQPYFLQLDDGRIIFAIPYETDFTLIGTTDVDHEGDAAGARCSDAERDYLIEAASKFFEAKIAIDDVVWTYSGVRPLYDDGASDAKSATRDYVLELSDENAAAPLLSVFGGKITTYRKLAEKALSKLTPYFPETTKQWTAGAPLPGGDYPVDGSEALIAELIAAYPFLDARWAQRLQRAYGRDAFELLGDAASASDLGRDYGATLTEREVEWLRTHEFAETAEDIVWRRSKLGLIMTSDQIAALDADLAKQSAAA